MPPLLFLACFSPLFTELLTGNAPLPLFVQPMSLLWLLITYSFPVVLLREFSVRKQLGLPAMFLMALAYGIYNEGIVAKTLVRAEGIPMPIFDQYGYGLGINWTWLLAMIPWHAAFSMVFPILIVGTLFPQERTQPWLGTISLSIMTAAAVGLGVLVNANDLGNMFFLYFWAAIIILLLLALWAGTRGPVMDMPCRPLLAIVSGCVSLLAYEAGLLLLADMRVHVSLYVAYAIVVALTHALLLRSPRRRSLPFLAFAGLGGYLFTGMARIAQTSPLGLAWEPLVVGSLLLLCILALIVTLMKTSKPLDPLH